MSKLKRKAGLRPVPVVTGALRHRRRNQRRLGLMTCAVRIDQAGGLPLDAPNHLSAVDRKLTALALSYRPEEMNYAAR